MTATDANGRHLQEVWLAAKDDLRLRMTKATYDQNIAGITVIGGSEDKLVLAAPNELVQDLLVNRLAGIVKESVSASAARPMEIEFTVRGENGRDPVAKSDETTSDDKDKEPNESHPGFGGFHPISSNFTQTPDLFFDWVLPHAHGTVAKLVGAVIRQTVGTFVDKRHNRRREEWPANIAAVMKACGVNSRASLYSALWDARADGYLVMRKIDGEEAEELSALCGYPVHFSLRIRYLDEPADFPSEDRPKYGPRRK